MIVYVRGRHVGPFVISGEQHGLTPMPNQSLRVQFAPDDTDILYEFVLPDQCAWITWVGLQHPEWLHEIWHTSPSTWNTPLLIETESL